ncbi:primosomal protein N' [Acinetobacter baumannii]|uniref:primosomal protein N' n=1 Tax=Acinetobacter baumannii TaxID=470 RepID=UPI0002AEC368|nr:primosomal protein N' [Acinetobacter baumannii]ELX07838.1 primosomal protein N' [Acinetobacter baumannii Naval-57]MDC4299094.1 primosomal protein N' [Acinetobacter baumannii]MDC4504459.1 primosomal protein N' [Acinetobacter baumannii]MDC4521326.1 primosomal protein N' [Acinetobacter baumannii]MDC4748492.1 primosomal protein N' [Acinetobacter baumannii]
MTITPKPDSVVYRVRVAVPVHLYDTFDYTLTKAQYERAQVGSRVAISFGRQNLIGIITEKVDPQETFTGNFQLKAISELLDDEPILDEQVLNLLTWSAQYYQFPIGEVMQTALPALLRQGKPMDVLFHLWKIIPCDNAEALLKRSIKQQDAYQILKLHPAGTTENILNLSGVETATLKALQKKGLVDCTLEPHDFSPAPVQLAQMPLTLNEDQKKATQHVLNAQHQYQAFLLDGLTGSGKTEVYLHIMHEVLKQGKQVLVLVPEIGLTPQTISRFKSRFNCDIALLHSGLNDSKRLQAWQQAQTGKASIILGTRSAIYTPLPRLGLIILDEEHDLSYKQQEGFRYHARDVALYRGHLQGCPVLLGSATPSIDSYHLVETGKLTALQLNQRAGHALLPKMHLIDLKIVKKQHGISQPLIEQIKNTLARKEQVLIFLNRRGYAPVLVCESCGWQANCPHCDAHFTLHTQPYSYLHCHHCGTVHRLPDHCPECQQKSLKTLGAGTAKVEEHLQELFPDHDVIRVDRDSTSRVGSWQKIYDRIQQNKPSILLGTQMLAKGHHFPHVTLVAILDIDAGLLSVDIRAPERTAQLIVQVAGRAGRGEHKGHVYLQTLRPDHPLLTTLIEKDYRAVAKQTLAERKVALLPPYRYAVLIRAESKDRDYTLHFLNEAAEQLRQIAGDIVDIWGPIPAPMERKAGRYRAHMVILSADRARLHFYLRQWWAQLVHTPRQHQLRLSIDVDPQEFS